MGHGHNHHEDHISTGAASKNSFVYGIILNVIFVIVEFGAGFYAGSLALIADAWHNLSDVAALGLSLLAFRMARLKPTNTYTYGYSKSTVLASLANCVLLFIAIGSIGYEAVQRFNDPVQPNGNIIWWTASIGVIINTVTALLFFRDKELNSRAAYLHMATDAMVSLGVVFSGLIIIYTGWLWVDAVSSLIICVVILFGTWSLLRRSLRLSLDGVPDNIDISKIHDELMQIPGVREISHIHVWALSTSRNAMTAMLTLSKDFDAQEHLKIKQDIRHELLHLNVHHATLETAVEEENTDCIPYPTLK